MWIPGLAAKTRAQVLLFVSPGVGTSFFHFPDLVCDRKLERASTLTLVKELENALYSHARAVVGLRTQREPGRGVTRRRCKHQWRNSSFETEIVFSDQAKKRSVCEQLSYLLSDAREASE